MQSLLTFYRDIIIKFEKVEDSQIAFTELAKFYWVSYVETQHASDEAKLFSAVRNDEQCAASLTLNMLKIKQDNQNNISRNGANLTDYQLDNLKPTKSSNSQPNQRTFGTDQSNVSTFSEALQIDQ